MRAYGPICLGHYEHAVNAAARIPGAQFVTMANGGHLFLGHEADVSRAIQEFLAYGAAGLAPIAYLKG
jgi:hypothetical protein